jgi:hypothetical protein
MFNLFSRIKVKISHNSFDTLTQTYHLKEKKISLLMNRMKCKKNWTTTFYFDHISNKQITFICSIINIKYTNNKEELNKNAQDFNIYFQ